MLSYTFVWQFIGLVQFLWGIWYKLCQFARWSGVNWEVAMPSSFSIERTIVCDKLQMCYSVASMVQTNNRNFRERRVLTGVFGTLVSISFCNYPLSYTFLDWSPFIFVHFFFLDACAIFHFLFSIKGYCQILWMFVG